MTILSHPMGPYETNCYIVIQGEESLIIDPGKGATQWVKQHAKNPLAILNTHGHFDHVWSNSELQKFYGIPVVVPRDDAFMLQRDPLGMGTPPSVADRLVGPDETLTIGTFTMTFRHFPGHTPGCSVIHLEDVMFSGDFVFQGSIGRTDFPYSDSSAMIKSIEKFMGLTNDATIYPGHGGMTTVKAEQRHLPRWIAYLR